VVLVPSRELAHALEIESYYGSHDIKKPLAFVHSSLLYSACPEIRPEDLPNKYHLYVSS